MTTDQQRVIVDAGGDDVIVITAGPDANVPKVVADAIADLTRKRTERLRTAPTASRDLHSWWLAGHQVYAHRKLPTGLDIWWEVPLLDDTIYAELDAGGDSDQVTQLIRWARAGLMFGRGYSTACPDGEAGSVHVADVRPVRRDEFLRARRDGWRPTGHSE